MSHTSIINQKHFSQFQIINSLYLPFVLTTKAFYFQNEMGEACSIAINGRNRYSGRKTSVEETTRAVWAWMEGILKCVLNEHAEWIQLTEDRDKVRVFVDMWMNLRTT
jgi:hypothetical protein